MSDEFNQNQQPDPVPQGNPYEQAPQQFNQAPVEGAGKTSATVSLVLGIISVVFAFVVPLVGVICAIVGLVFASKAKKEGFIGGMRTAGFVLSIIGLVLAIIMWIVTAVVIGAVGLALANL